jgi:hypothetical protein
MPWRRKPVSWLRYWEGPVNRDAGFKTVLVYCVGPPNGKLCGHCGSIPLEDLPDWDWRGLCHRLDNQRPSCARRDLGRLGVRDLSRIDDEGTISGLPGYQYVVSQIRQTPRRPQLLPRAVAISYYRALPMRPLKQTRYRDKSQKESPRGFPVNHRRS